MENKVFISFLKITSFYCNKTCLYSSKKVKQQEITTEPEFHSISVKRIGNCILLCDVSFAVQYISIMLTENGGLTPLQKVTIHISLRRQRRLI